MDDARMDAAIAASDAARAQLVPYGHAEGGAWESKAVPWRQKFGTGPTLETIRTRSTQPMDAHWKEIDCQGVAQGQIEGAAAAERVCPETKEFLWFGRDDRELIVDFSERQRASVTISEGGPSGTLLADEEWVLIAAHSIWNTPPDDAVACLDALVDEGSMAEAWTCFWEGARDPSHLSVCTMGALAPDSECRNVSETIVSPDYEGSHEGDIGDDYAVLHLLNRFSDDEPATMHLSAADDGVIADILMHSASYPRFGPDCLCNQVAVNEHQIRQVDVGAHGYQATAEVIGTPGDELHTLMDVGDGSSGSAFFYCGDAFCNLGDPGFITGVMHGAERNIFNEITATGGAKANSIRDWVMEMTPTGSPRVPIDW
jgi:hypothetical protein